MNSGQCPVESGLGMCGAALSHMCHTNVESVLAQWKYSVGCR